MKEYKFKKFIINIIDEVVQKSSIIIDIEINQQIMSLTQPIFNNLKIETEFYVKKNKLVDEDELEKLEKIFSI
ncbi:hypothetical protein WQ54_21910 [Bacillus sp. SA1-12]|uniref:hypothetical protein n=1 Tax=Bacillus sp. SA1-12 TaxID=1455638 RepID=UPI0006272A54|nr:hypothetical protein [Bacillus sp. SA1-12]KKI90582.1 hypothetical protein WQ54_21910 [Bacillus sp. SA1-12]